MADELELGERYVALGVLSRGALSHVHRVHDRDLGRAVVMKILTRKGQSRAGAMGRFAEEAQVAAQLEHPGIVPVYDIGQLGDGRWYFTMRDVKGRTLGSVIKAVHLASRAGSWGEHEGWTFRRLVDALRRVCETVGFAHERGVLHRDLKPGNIMVGPFGEVLVIDWGLARVDEADLAPVTSRTQVGDELATVHGTVAGTPGYMPPEQARGELERLGPRTDVHALGGVLYRVLTGRAAYPGTVWREVLDASLAGPPTPVTDIDGLPALPEDLVAVQQQAMAREPEDRFADALAMGQALGAWLDGARRRERALERFREAEQLRPRIAELRGQAAEARVEARLLLAQVAPHEPVAQKRMAWQLEDDARELEEEAGLAEVAFTQALRAALNRDPELSEAHAALADHYRRRHEQVEAGGAGPAAILEGLLRAHDAGRHLDYLRGHGAVSLVTDPPGAQVELFRFEERDRRLVATHVRSLGATPLVSVELPMGSYLLVVRAEGCPPVRYPVHLRRCEHHDGRDGSGREQILRLPRAGELSDGECFVPPGWFTMGGDRAAQGSLPRARVWVDGFVMETQPITHADFIAWLNDLAARDRLNEALTHAPRGRPVLKTDRGPVLYPQDERGFGVGQGPNGEPWQLDWPALCMDWHAAMAYASWRARRDGVPWRLPGELEWEKAARGVDGRRFPWGDHLDPSWCCMEDSAAAPSAVPVSAFTTDVSPYGVRGLAGNGASWCLDLFHPEGPALDRGRYRPPLELDGGWAGGSHVVRGGAWDLPEPASRAASRRANPSVWRRRNIGLRLVRSI